MPEVELLQFIRDERGAKVGYVDFKVTHSPEKIEKYRNWAVFVKENRKWISDPKCKRVISQDDGTEKEMWVSIYERTPSLSTDIYTEILATLENDYI